MNGAETIAEIRKRSDTVLLSFSCGKDSIGAWLALRPHFARVIPFYLWSIPDLEFVEDNLRYYEDFFGTRIYQLPHPRIYRMLRNNVFQPPQNWPICQMAELPVFDYQDVEDRLREQLGLPDVYAANGVRACDSITRRTSIKKHGPISHAKKKFYPIWDWSKQRLIDEIVNAGVKLPTDYRVFGRSFDGINWQFLAPMKEHFPRDYARVLEYFPLAEVELKRMQYAAQS